MGFHKHVAVKANYFQVRVIASKKKPLCRHQPSVKYLVLSDFFRDSSNASVSPS